MARLEETNRWAWHRLVVPALLASLLFVSGGDLAAASPSSDRVEIERAPDGLVVWSPTGERYVINRKDSAGVYQLYVGEASGGDPICITCSGAVGGPAVDRHKLQPHWHPSGQWIALAGERASYQGPILSTPEIIEGLVQSGLWVDIYLTTPDGSQWQQMTDYENQQADGFTGVAFTPDGAKAVWAEIVDGNIFENLFGHWELMLADVTIDADGIPSFTNRRNITPAGANWIEPGNFAPDNRTLLISADIGLDDPQGMDQYLLDIQTGTVTNLTNSPGIWDEHGVFSPDGSKIFFMSSYPFRDNPWVHNVLFLHTEFMLMSADGTGLEQLTHYNTPGYPETNTGNRGSTAANGAWHPDGRSISAINLFFPVYETWTIRFGGGGAPSG